MILVWIVLRRRARRTLFAPVVVPLVSGLVELPIEGRCKLQLHDDVPGSHSAAEAEDVEVDSHHMATAGMDCLAASSRCKRDAAPWRHDECQFHGAGGIG